MVRLVLFDIDGTLIQSGGAGEQAFAQVCEIEFGIPNGAARLQFAGRTDPSIVRDFFVQHSIAPSADNFQRFFGRYVHHLDDFLRRLSGTVLPGVHGWLDALALLSHQPVQGLLTGNIRRGAELKLTHYGLWKCFRLGAYGDDHEDRNQIAVMARERGQQFLERSLDGSEILVIGDTPRDIECARAIGARCLAVATGKYTVEELVKHEPTWAAKTLEEISPETACR
jgi:phosphoglycolate phosphatase